MAACAWAIREDVPERVAHDLDALAAQEPAHEPGREAGLTSWRQPPRHERSYRQLLGDADSSKRVWSGPAFAFPETPQTRGGADARGAAGAGVSTIDDESLLARQFRGWVPGEIAAGRSPVMAVLEGGEPVSICFCARRSALAAEAGVETAAAFRGQGCAAVVTGAWAAAVREMGLLPLYSTHWDNAASLAVARKLGLIPYASDWSIE